MTSRENQEYGPRSSAAVRSAFHLDADSYLVLHALKSTRFYRPFWFAFPDYNWPIREHFKARVRARGVGLRRLVVSSGGRHLGRFVVAVFFGSKILFQLDMTGGYGGRKLFVGGLPPKVDEKALRDVFSRFWHIEEGS